MTLVAYPPDSPAATRHGLCNSLLVCHRVPLSAHLPSLQQNYSTWLLCTTTSGAKAHSTHSQNLLQRITRIQYIFYPQNAIRYIDLVFFKCHLLSESVNLKFSTTKENVMKTCVCRWTRTVRCIRCTGICRHSDGQFQDLYIFCHII